MQYLILAYDGTDEYALNRRMKAREQHITLGNKLRDENKLLFAVAILNEMEKMIGSMCIVDFPNLEEVNNWLKVEPYVVGKVWEKIEIKPCRVGPSFCNISKV